MEDLREECAFS
jgi:hypothetical protein